MTGKNICADCNAECLHLWGVNLCEMCYNYITMKAAKIRGDVVPTPHLTFGSGHSEREGGE